MADIEKVLDEQDIIKENEYYEKLYAQKLRIVEKEGKLCLGQDFNEFIKEVDNIYGIK